ncbi:NAD(P)/FAD-dependent oxidoreductase [Gephyromycinifex aptenodytis]|uniref:NAD(P)/FAD-dependent oxidoreductase n=1 Tax=Gephyromycinifex aptenodytis TaxID=2716227 RepID=UPI001446CBC4|nr:NAD(P)/FAD-dependent oxidoreductase [Gephyromycinifex aptenodytis]
MTTSAFDIRRLIPSRARSTQPEGQTHDQHGARRPHIVIVGGGFAGLAAARRLRDEPVDVTIIDRNAYNTFQPLLYQVATATLNPGDVTWALRSVHGANYGAQFILGEVEAMDHEARHLHLKDGRVVWYDYLLICTGVVVNYFGIEGADKYSYPLYTRRQALALRDATQHALERAARAGQDEDLRVVIVGAGATGVEMAGAMAEMCHIDLPVLFPELDPERIRITLVEMAPHVLMPFTSGSREYAEQALRSRGVDLRLGTSVTAVSDEGVTLATKDGDTKHEEFLPAQIVVWASGIQAAEAVGRWGLKQGKGGRILVDDQMRALGHERIFVAGDISLREDSPLPQQAQPALQTGEHVGAVIAAQIHGQQPPTFEYRDLGSLATIGRSDAVAEAKAFPNLTGFPAWLVWNAVHIRALLGGRNRVASMVNLGSKYLFWSRDHNLIVGEPVVTGTDGERARR